MKPTLFLKTLSLLALAMPSLANAAGQCPVAHCSQISADMNAFCVSNGFAGRPYMVLGPDGAACLCPCSCVAEDTLFSSSDGFLTEVRNLKAGISLATPLASQSGAIMKAPIVSQVTSHPTIEIRLENGSRILVSKNHNFVAPNGKVAIAEKLTAGSYILGADQLPSRVMSVNNVDYTGKLVNVMVNTQSRSPLDHVVVTNGVLSGDFILQINSDQLDGEIDLRMDLLHADF